MAADDQQISQKGEEPMPMTTADGVKKDRVICTAIKKAESELRRQYSFLQLQYQDLFGTLIFLTSCLMIGFFWWFYFQDPTSYLHCMVVIIGVGFFTSLLHELEHDLIHNQYYKKYPYLQDIMFFCIWISKLHGNPWYRREMHLKHHMVSGQRNDAEERLIGLGIPFGFRRMAVSMYPFGMLIEIPTVSVEAPWLDVRKMNLSSAPVAFFFMTFNKIFFVYLLAMYCLGDGVWESYLPSKYWYIIRAVNVCSCLPNILRQMSIQVMSNISHYYGDIPENTAFFQNQIMDHWMLYPFQFFCMNFAATHIVHHYVPNQPFYIRELVYPRVKSFMVEQGVRLNDFSTISRGNHYYSDSAKTILAPNHSGHASMFLWLFLMTTVAPLCYIIFDKWAFIAMSRRILKAYILPMLSKSKTN